MADMDILFSDYTRVNINDIRAKALKLKRERGLDLLVLDYLQLVNGALSGVNRQEQVSDMSRGLKLLARELECPVIALAQLNRAADGQTGGLANLRESGSLEQDADVVIILSREFTTIDVEGCKVSEAVIDVAKFRNGSTGKEEYYYEGAFLRFTEKQRFIQRKQEESRMAVNGNLSRIPANYSTTPVLSMPGDNIAPF